MKRFISMSLAAALAVTSMVSMTAFAQPHPGGPAPGYNRPSPSYRPGTGPGWHRWHRGDRFRGNRYIVRNWGHYGLRPPPPGYYWVQNGSQFLLIAAASGLIANVILNSR